MRMRMEDCEKVKKAFKDELNAEFSLLDIKGMSRVNEAGIDDEVYVLVDTDAMLYVTRLRRKTVYGEIEKIFVNRMPIRF